MRQMGNRKHADSLRRSDNFVRVACISACKTVWSCRRRKRQTNYRSRNYGYTHLRRGLHVDGAEHCRARRVASIGIRAVPVAHIRTATCRVCFPRGVAVFLYVRSRALFLVVVSHCGIVDGGNFRSATVQNRFDKDKFAERAVRSYKRHLRHVNALRKQYVTAFVK